MRCGRCKVMMYCSKECQRSHWRVHKRGCERLYNMGTMDRLKSEGLSHEDAYYVLEYAEKEGRLFKVGSAAEERERLRARRNDPGEPIPLPTKEEGYTDVLVM